MVICSNCNECTAYLLIKYDPPHDKTNKITLRPAKTQISLGMCPVWSESSLSAWRKLGSLATHWAHSEGSDQTERMPRMIFVFAGRTVIVLVLSWGGSYNFVTYNKKSIQQVQRDVTKRAVQERKWQATLEFEPPHDKTNNVVVLPARLRSAWASVQSDQSIRCALNG